MKRILKVVALMLVALVILLAVAITFTIGWRPFTGPRARTLTDRRFASTPARMERGRYLVEGVVGCVNCHSELDWKAPMFPPKPETLGSGRSWAQEGLPWVTTPNITPDVETGAGGWSDDQFARAIREGVSHDGRALFPLMPYPRWRSMSDEDVASIIVYMRSTKPVRRAQPPTEMPFPMNRFINLVPEPVHDPVPEPDRTNRVRYGEYLVTIAACADCHTPFDQQGAVVPGMDFGGGSVFQGPYPLVASGNLTQDPSGIPYYTEELFIEAIRTGMVKARKLHDIMPWGHYRLMTDEDLKAMFAYIKTFKPVQHRVDNSLPPTLCPRCGNSHGAGEQNRR